MGKYIRFDWAMKRLLRDKANFVVLEGLLSALLGMQIKIDRLLESESNQTAPDDKQNRVDLLAEDSEHNKFIIEVQNESETAYFQRVLFGTSKLVTEYMKRGAGYEEVQKIYSINIIFFDLGEGDDYVYHGRTEFRGIHSNSLLNLSPFQREKFNADEVYKLFPEYYILKVNGFNKVARTPIEEWLRFLKDEVIDDDTTVPGLREAREIMLYDRMSPEEKRGYDKHLDNIVVLRDNIETARVEGGVQRGVQKGVQKGAEGELCKAIEIARNMLQAGIPRETVASITALPPDKLP